MSDVLVTGGTGFIGANVARELVATGAGVRVLARPRGDRRALDGVGVEIVEGDLLEPASAGQMIVDFMRGRMVATLDTGLNIVHVRDVARGHVLAAERGKSGERYILGHAAGNLSLADIFRALAAVTGRRPPRFRVPYALAWCSAAACETIARVTGRPPAVPLTAVRMARKRMYFSAAKAVRDLGLPQTDPRVALADAVGWFVAHGYARG